MRLGLLMLSFCLFPLGATAELKEWSHIPGLSSAVLADDNWDLQSSSGLSWPDGRQAIVTFWLAPLENGMVRCVAFFDASFRATGESCERHFVDSGQ